MKKNSPREWRVSMNKWEGGEADGHQNKTDRDQLWFAHFFDQTPDGPALNGGADDSAVGKEQADRARILAVLYVEVKIFSDEQAERRFETGETERGKEEHSDE